MTRLVLPPGVMTDLDKVRVLRAGLTVREATTAYAISAITAEHTHHQRTRHRQARNLARMKP